MHILRASGKIGLANRATLVEIKKLLILLTYLLNIRSKLFQLILVVFSTGLSGSSHYVVPSYVYVF